MFYVKLLNFIFTQLIVKFQYCLYKPNFPYSGTCEMTFRYISKNMSKKKSYFFSIFQHFHLECKIKLCNYFLLILPYIQLRGSKNELIFNFKM
jgi:hypothetical protein